MPTQKKNMHIKYALKQVVLTKKIQDKEKKWNKLGSQKLVKKTLQLKPAGTF